MLDRKDVKERHPYLLNGKPVWVYMIHKPCSGESVTVSTIDPAVPNFYERWSEGILSHMQMRKFQKVAALQ